MQHALDPMLVAHYRDRLTGAEAWLVGDTFLHGVAGGGIRMAPDVDETLMRHLASTMSVKLSILHPPCGGAKCGIRYDSRSPDSKDVLHRVLRAFAPFLQQCWVTGSDLGTSWHDIVTACRKQANIPHPQFALMKAYGGDRHDAVDAGIERLKRGTSLIVDDSIRLEMSDAVTGWTVSASTIEAFALRGESIVGKRVAIQGFGSVGGSAAKFLAEAGAVIIAVSDELGAVVADSTAGLDIPALLAMRSEPARKVIDRELLRSRFSYRLSHRDDVLYQDVDVLIPAAGSYITIDLMRVLAKVIAEGANDPFAEEEELNLHQRGITVIPDAIANSGSAGLYGLLVAGDIPLSKPGILTFLETQVREMTRRVLEHRQHPPRLALETLAQTRIQAYIQGGHSPLPRGFTPESLKELESDDLTIRYRGSAVQSQIVFNNTKGVR
ncbi:MAG: hypothetical protein L0Y80_01815 [Ignavibacteriae bacterium]|nr:hypothetical protein [Ignavibacteriota bacterium]